MFRVWYPACHKSDLILDNNDINNTAKCELVGSSSPVDLGERSLYFNTLEWNEFFGPDVAWVL